MALFSLKKINEAAAGRQAYLRGVSLYNSGKVTGFVRTHTPFYDEYIAADVAGDEPGVFHHAEAGLSADGRAEYLACDCPAAHAPEGACKHVVALLVHKYYADMVGGLSGGRGAGTPLKPRSDEAARRMMEGCLARQAAEMAAESAAESELVTLLPALELSGRQPRLGFTLGVRRQYVLKDIARFCADMAAGAAAEYGKQLRFVHHPAAFSPSSRPLLAFLQREYGDLLVRQQAAGAYGTAAKIGKELPLSPGAFDRFFELYAGQDLDVRIGGEPHTLRFVDGNPSLAVEVSASEGRDGLRLRTADALPLEGTGSRLYVLHGGSLFRCGEAYAAHMADWIAAARQSPGGLFVAEEDLPAFCSSVLPAIRPHVCLEGEPECLEPYQPEELETLVYLDAPDPGTVTARVECRYGDTAFNPYGGEEPAVRRDRLGELRARLTLQKYFTAYLPAEGYLLFHGDDDALFHFVDTGVEEISRCAEVYATERFKKIGVAPPPRVSIGVRLFSDLLEFDFDVSGLDLDELSRLLDSYRQHKKYHRLNTGEFIQIEDTALAGLAEIAEGLGLTEKELRTGRISLPKYRAMYLDKLLREQEGIQFQRDAAFRALVKNMKAVADSDYAVPSSLGAVLRNYQKTGFRWLKTMEAAGFGGILADDMGLGKTLQIIALLLDARENGNDRPSLVVCPASLVLNWENEIRRFAPALTVLPVLGNAEERAALLRKTAGYDVVITSYDLLRRDVEQYVSKTFRYHILDEAQAIKNHNTQNARSVKAIRSAQRFALTGTPIENRLSELWSIFDFLMPGFLYSYSRFREKLEAPIVRGGDPAALERLNKMTAPFILRRLKREVLRELPPKIESVLTATMEDEQRQLYLANAAQARRELAQDPDGRNRMNLLALLTRLRQICCDPRLCYEDYGGGSCKLDACMELLREAAGTGHKVLLFSQFTSMLAILAKKLEEEGLSYYLLQGSTSKESRAAMVESFNRDDTQVFLISLKAGGAGLNLTGADLVILYDPWWNVSAQNQAADRAHRIGQTRSVQVIRLIARDTIEEKILLLQESKRELVDAVIREGNAPLSALSPEELLELLE